MALLLEITSCFLNRCLDLYCSVFCYRHRFRNYAIFVNSNLKWSAFSIIHRCYTLILFLLGISIRCLLKTAVSDQEE